MLSKSGARAFFVAGTVLCSGVFIGLTVDTFGKIPAQTNASRLTPEVIRGKHLWEANNCMGCHTLLGEGAYYAPELTRVFERRGPAFISAMLKDPQSVYPGRRKMVQYDFTEQEIGDLIAFFDWVGQMDLNGFPPQPTITSAGSAAAPAGANVPLTFRQTCTACHSLGGYGGRVGPALDGVADRLDAGYLRRWLQNPQELKPGTLMPRLPLTDEELTALVDFLGTLHAGGTK